MVGSGQVITTMTTESWTSEGEWHLIQVVNTLTTLSVLHGCRIPHRHNKIKGQKSWVWAK